MSIFVILTDFGKEGDPTNLLDRYWARIEVSVRVTTIHTVCQSTLNETSVSAIVHLWLANALKCLLSLVFAVAKCIWTNKATEMIQHSLRTTDLCQSYMRNTMTYTQKCTQLDGCQRKYASQSVLSHVDSTSELPPYHWWWEIHTMTRDVSFSLDPLMTQTQ